MGILDAFSANPFGASASPSGGGDEIELRVPARAQAAGTPESLATLGLPDGSWVTSKAHPDKGAFAWLSDEKMDLASWWPRLLRAWPRSGWWPMIVPVENEMVDLVRGGGLDGPCEIPDDYAELTGQLLTEQRELGEDEQAWKLADAPLATGSHPSRLLTTQYPVAEHLMLVPVDRVADALARIGWNGGASAGLDGGHLSCALRSWEERFGAVVGEIGPVSLMIDVTAPPQERAEQELVLRELNAWCPEQFLDGELDDFLDMAENSPWMLWWS